MNIDFELYRIFYVVANNGNITRASKELNISQPAVSKSIKMLEDQLGGELFVRTKRGVSLTEEGVEFYHYIKQAIEYISNAENKFSEMINLEVGSIRIGCTATLTKEFLMPYLEKFHESYPKINIQIITNMASELYPMLRNGLIDLIVLNTTGKSFDPDIEVVDCKKITDCFVVGSAYKDLVDTKIDLKDLNDYSLILQAKGSNTRYFIDNFAKDHGVILKPNIELASYTLVVEFAKTGFGIGYATRDYIKNELEGGSLFELNVTPKIPSRYVGIATLKTRIPSFSTQKFVEMVLGDK